MNDPAFHPESSGGLDELLDAMCERALAAEEIAALERLASADPAARRRLVAMLSLDAALRWEQADANSELGNRNVPHSPPRTPTPSPPRAKRLVHPLLLPLAAALLIAAAAVAIYFFVLNSQPETRDPKLAAPVASIIDTTGGTLLLGDRVINPGDEIGPGEVSLDAGSADFRLRSGVSVTLRGRSTLTVHDPMSATLARGSATFDCPHTAVGYTVHLPGGARVVDLGTAFTVAAGEDTPVTVTVTQGSVEVRDASDAPLTLTADQSAVALLDPATGTSRFRRADPMLRYDPAVATAARFDGTFTVGSLVEVGGEPLWLTHLGVQDAGPEGGLADDGFHTAEPIPVGLWDESGERLLASVQVPGDAPRIAGWRYAAIAGGPIRLEPNTRYRIGALAGAGVEWFLDADTAAAFSAGPGLRLVDACYHARAFAAPMTPGLGVPGRWAAANALTSPIPSDSIEHTPAADRRAQEKNSETDPSQEQEP